MLSRDITLKLNEFVVKATGNAYGQNSYGNMAKVLADVFNTDPAMRAFLSTADKYLIAWKPDGTLQDLKGNKIDTNSFEVSAALNQSAPQFYAIREKSNSVVQVDNSKVVQGSPFGQAQPVTAGFNSDTTTLLIAAGLLVLGMLKMQGAK